jgi:hypothetical protein
VRGIEIENLVVSSAAYHKAGHAAAMIALKLPFDFIELHEQGGRVVAEPKLRLRRGYSYSSGVVHAPALVMTSATPVGEFIVAHAGMIALRRLLSSRGFSFSSGVFDDSADESRLVKCLTQIARERRLKEPDKIENLRAQMKRESATLIERNWAGIEGIAQALLRSEIHRLTGSDARRIFRQAMPRSGSAPLKKSKGARSRMRPD